MTLRQDFAGAAGADAALLLTVGKSLVAIHDRTFCSALFDAGGNGVLLGYLMYTSRLVPRPLALLGLVGGPLLIASWTAPVRALRAVSVWGAIATLPVAAWELTPGIWLIVRDSIHLQLLPLSTNPDDGVLTGVVQPAVVPSNGRRVPSKVSATSNGPA